MRGTRTLLVATAVALTTGVVAEAGNLSFLANSPSGHFSSEDVRLLRETALQLLLHEEVGATRTWHNPHSTASGEITIVKLFESADGFLCKVLLIKNSAGGWHGRATYPVCEIHPGDWKLHAGAVPAAKTPESPNNSAK